MSQAQLSNEGTHSSFTTVRHAVSRMTGPQQRVEFVAKALTRDPHTVLATPDYVALLD